MSDEVFRYLPAAKYLYHPLFINSYNVVLLKQRAHIEFLPWRQFCDGGEKRKRSRAKILVHTRVFWWFEVLRCSLQRRVKPSGFDLFVENMSAMTKLSSTKSLSP